jgi:hypothetical protein
MKRAHNIPIGESVNKQLLDIAKKFGGGHVRVGFLEDKKYPDGTPVAQVAFWDEFGHGGPFPAPPRPFFREMVKKYSPQWPNQLAILAEKYDYNGTIILAAMGKLMEEQLRVSMLDMNSPALSPTTALLHERFPGTAEFSVTIQDVLKAQADIKAGTPAPSGTVAKPLVWSGTMLSAVGSEVTK